MTIESEIANKFNSILLMFQNFILGWKTIFPKVFLKTSGNEKSIFLEPIPSREIFEIIILMENKASGPDNIGVKILKCQFKFYRVLFCTTHLMYWKKSLLNPKL